MSDKPLQQADQEVRIPFLDQSEFRGFSNRGGGGALGADATFINVYPAVAKNPLTGEGEAFLVKRPGLEYASMSLACSALTQTMPKAHLCMTKLTDVNVAAIFDENDDKIYVYQYRPTANTTTLIGTLTSAHVNDVVYLTEVMLTTSEVAGFALVWIKNAGTTEMHYAQSSSGVFTATTLTKVTDADFPPNKATPEELVGPAQQLDSFIYVMTTRGDVYCAADVYDITAWDANKKIETYAYADNGVGLFRFKHHLVAFCSNSIEFFSNEGNAEPAPPIVRTEQAFIKFGAVHAKAIKNIDDVLYWISASDSTTVGLWKLDGYTPVRISTPRENMEINSAYVSGSRIVSLETLVVGGSKNLLINGVISYSNMVYSGFTQNGSDTSFTWNTNDARPSILAFNLDTNVFWHIADAHIQSGTFWLPAAYYKDAFSGKFQQYILKGSDSVGANNYIYRLSAASTYVGFLDQDGSSTVPADEQAVPVIIQLNGIEFGTERVKRIDKVKLIGDYMTRAGGDTSTPYIYFLFSRVDQPNSSADIVQRHIVMPTAAPFRYHINNLGQYRKMTVAIAFKNKCAWRGKALEMMVSQGTM